MKFSQTLLHQPFSIFRKIAFAFTAMIAFAACGEQTTVTRTGAHSSADTKEITRDMSITKSNAYNDIFLDSTDLEKFIVADKLNDTLANAMRDFYNVRNFQYAWFASTGLVEQALSFHSSFCTENNCDLFNKSLEDRLDRLRVEEDSTISPKDPATIKTELQITQRFIQYPLESYKNKNISAADLGTYVPAKKASVGELAEAMTADNNNTRTHASINETYKLLKEPLKKYMAIAKNGGWPAIATDAKKINIGTNSPAVRAIKKRLQITGELPATDTTTLFGPELESAIKTYQSAHGFKPTGVVTPDLVKDLNIPALARVQQILINMQRMLWMPAKPAGKLILVNIPEFVLHVYNGKTNDFNMDVVVGSEGHNTTMFRGDLNQVVFSPYWNVPPSIVKNEILPAIDRNSNYLNKKNMEITGEEGGLPVIRQLPGGSNALGRVKFLFPNSFNIYMHDTPEKSLFSRSERGLSHGCIRLSDPVKMANYLLQDSPTWTPEKIEAAMNSGDEQFVKLKNPVPVIITYYTTWVDDKGAVHFADDIYGHDKQMATKMFTDPI